jgi:hypothetical protein
LIVVGEVARTLVESTLAVISDRTAATPERVDRRVTHPEVILFFDFAAVNRAAVIREVEVSVIGELVRCLAHGVTSFDELMKKGKAACYGRASCQSDSLISTSARR